MAEQPWFHYYKSRGQRRLVPVSKAGWLMTIAMIVAVTTPGLLMAIVQQSWVLWIMFPWIAVSLFVFFRLAFRHSETIPVEDAIKLWRSQQSGARKDRRP